MRYHDYHLKSYEVSDWEATITLHLVDDYPGKEVDHSDIRFSEVALYSFTHTHGAIITDIYERSLSEAISEMDEQLQDWARMYGVKGWKSDIQTYLAQLEADTQRAWLIESAIGFFGVVIAKSVAQA